MFFWIRELVSIILLIHLLITLRSFPQYEDLSLCYNNRFLKLTKLGAVVLLSFAICWYPFLWNTNNFLQVIHRLFPFARGLYEVQYFHQLLWTLNALSASFYSWPIFVFSSGQSGLFLVHIVTGHQTQTYLCHWISHEIVVSSFQCISFLKRSPRFSCLI